MEISQFIKDDTCTLSLSGRLDTLTSPQLEEKLNEVFGKEYREVVIDLRELEYISSAGLRVLLYGQKNMPEKGKLIIRNAGDQIMEVFELTGFVDILTIE